MAQSGSGSFDDFARRSWRSLWRIGWALTLDPYEAEELAQEALARTLTRWRRFHADPEAGYAYTRRVLLNLRTDRWRRREREAVRMPSQLERGPTGAEEVVDDRDELLHLLSTLTEKQRRVVVLRYLLDLPVSEVAQELSMTESNVKVTAMRALARMRESRSAGQEDGHVSDRG